MKKLIFIAIIVALFWGGFFVGTNGSHILLKEHSSVVPRDDESSVNVKTVQVGVPKTLRIPQIGVVASVEQVGLDAQGRMDVPKDADNVGWYKLGYKPSEKGNAVLAGHFDRETGTPAVFWNITQLKLEDKIYVTDSQGKEHVFSLTKIDTYPDNNFPIKEVFGESIQPKLNLITCQGTWNNVSKNYSHRIVFSAELRE